VIDKYYENKKRWNGALVYYNEVLLKDPDSKYAEESKQRIDAIKKLQVPQTAHK
jgi:outer membrane protein assembly factor BamD (BamD/ComL family)